LTISAAERACWVAACALCAGCAGAPARVNTELSPRPGANFELEGAPFCFVGANNYYLAHAPRPMVDDVLESARAMGVRVVRTWAFIDRGSLDGRVPSVDGDGTKRGVWFQGWDPTTQRPQFNDGDNGLQGLDYALARAEQLGLKLVLVLTNNWHEFGGMDQYLRWYGLSAHSDFYRDVRVRAAYRAWLSHLTSRLNSLTQRAYRDDPTIFGWELMNEAQVITGRWAERRAWFEEMSGYLKSLDPNHMVAPGAWGYRSSSERREWLADHAIPTIDYCDVHSYPRDDHDSFVDSPKALQEFIENRAAAAYSLRKPLVLGEFGMGVDSFNGASQLEWYRALFEGSARAGAGGAMFWILTPDARRGYGVTYSTSRDQQLLGEVQRASQMFASLQSADVPSRVEQSERHLIPRQFAWDRAEGDPSTLPQMIVKEDKTVLYQFKPQMARAERFEKIGEGSGYIWGFGSGYLEYTVPARADRRRVSEIVVRAHIQPVLPVDASTDFVKTRVTLFVEGWDGGSRLIPVEPKGEPIIQEWRLTGMFLRLRAMRGLPLKIRFAVTPESDWLYGVNISNWPEGYDSKDARPVEVELRH